MTSHPRELEVRVQYVSDCPHGQLAAQRVRAAFANIGRRDIAVVLECVRNGNEAELLAFRGSPTVLVNGRDPFADPAGAVGLSCRRYPTEEGIEGAPSVGQLSHVLAVLGDAR